MIDQTRNLKSNFLMHKTIPYTYELELDILKIYLRTKSELSSSRLLKVRELRSANTHRRETERCDQTFYNSRIRRW